MLFFQTNFITCRSQYSTLSEIKKADFIKFFLFIYTSIYMKMIYLIEHIMFEIKKCKTALSWQIKS